MGERAQRQALEALAEQLQLTGEDRLAVAYRRMFFEPKGRVSPSEPQLRRRFEALRRKGLAAFGGSLAGPAERPGPTHDRLVNALGAQALRGEWDDLLQAASADDDAATAQETREVQAAKLLRLIRLGKSVVLGHRVESGPDARLKLRYAKLRSLEGESPLPFAGVPGPPGNSCSRAVGD